MPIVNRSLETATRRKCFTHQIVMATTALQARGDVDSTKARKILAIEFLYDVASDTGAWQNIEVGIPGTNTKYLAAAGENSKSIGYVKSQTVASADLVPAGTAIIVRRANTTAGANTGVITVHVWYETID